MFDVVVIGAGIMGAAVSRELSKYELKVLLLDKENDVSCGTTKANSAIVHAGYDAKEGSLMAKYNVLGNAMYEDLCKEVDAPFRKVGSYVLAFSEKEKEHLEMLYQRGLNNGVPEMEIIDAAEIQKRELHVSKEAVAALYAGTAGITGPWELTIKLVENAMENGVELKLNSEVTNIKKENNIFKIERTCTCSSSAARASAKAPVPSGEESSTTRTWASGTAARTRSSAIGRDSISL